MELSGKRLTVNALLENIRRWGDMPEVRKLYKDVMTDFRLSLEAGGEKKPKLMFRDIILYTFCPILRMSDLFDDCLADDRPRMDADEGLRLDGDKEARLRDMYAMYLLGKVTPDLFYSTAGSADYLAMAPWWERIFATPDHKKRRDRVSWDKKTNRDEIMEKVRKKCRAEAGGQKLGDRSVEEVAGWVREQVRIDERVGRQPEEVFTTDNVRAAMTDCLEAFLGLPVWEKIMRLDDRAELRRRKLCEGQFRVTVQDHTALRHALVELGEKETPRRFSQLSGKKQGEIYTWLAGLNDSLAMDQISFRGAERGCFVDPFSGDKDSENDEHHSGNLVGSYRDDRGELWVLTRMDYSGGDRYAEEKGWRMERAKTLRDRLLRRPGYFSRFLRASAGIEDDELVDVTWLWERYLDALFHEKLLPMAKKFLPAETQSDLEIFSDVQGKSKVHIFGKTWEHRQPVRPDHVVLYKKRPVFFVDAKFKPGWMEGYEGNELSESLARDFYKCMRDMAMLGVRECGVVFPVMRGRGSSGGSYERPISEYNTAKFYTIPLFVPAPEGFESFTAWDKARREEEQRTLEKLGEALRNNISEQEA